MVDLPHVLGIASLRKFLKAYKSLVTKWHQNNKSSSSKARIEANNEANHENLGDGRHKEQSSDGDGSDSFRYFGGSIIDDDDDDPTSPRIHRHRRSCFPSITSLSRSSSRRSRTPSRSSLFRSMSWKSNEDSSSPNAIISRKSPDSTPSPPYLSKSVSGRRAGSGRSSTPILFSNSSGQLIKQPANEMNLECTLEELFHGCKRKLKITRDVIGTNGQFIQEDEMLTIKVKPGWKKGTKITFEGMGNERHGSSAADLTFVIAEKRHDTFKREGDDLELAVSIPLLKALTGCSISIPLLGGSEKMHLKIQDIVYPGYEKIISGQGMPTAQDEAKRGDLKIKFQVEFPTELTDEQRSDVVSILQDTTS